MAAINDLISQIQDETLRNRIQEEVSKMAKQKKFGLVFEEHMPESTPLYDMPIKRGCNVMRRDSKDDKSIYVVLRVEGDTAVCVKPEQKDEAVTFDLKDIVRVAEFGESIYPYLKPLDSVCNAPDSDLWHTLIEADNYHALQLLEYLYAGKVDCIYIDPPYNTGAKDWKYNNDYVDGNDAYRHSKWLSFMQRRLKLAKKLLNPADSVLIVTIDEKEYLHLGCLLEEMFPEAQIQMVSLEKFVAFENKSKLTNAKKLLKAKNSPVLQMKKNDLLENLKKHSRYKTMFKFEEDHIVISSQKEAAAFIKMLNDDIVRSELTGKEYDSSSKMLLGPVGASH